MNKFSFLWKPQNKKNKNGNCDLFHNSIFSFIAENSELWYKRPQLPYNFFQLRKQASIVFFDTFSMFFSSENSNL